ncbi:hypothetical protein [Salaquimonas pukyongi]|uniref:hypothetical protein n=1 Tax=Salaquimonas pukyongi TaxID=2712698 RepID=UPI00096BA24B|nr:hypothetical protein [Salaquimonas pukyongi]
MADIKLANSDLRGKAVKLFENLLDNNDSVEAVEQTALDNFDTFKKSFADTNRKFIEKANNQAGT